MKNISALLVVALCSLVIRQGYGQTEKGTFLLGSAVKGSSTKTENRITGIGYASWTKQTSLSFTISPDLSYFVIDRLAIGLTTPYTFIRTKNGDAKSTVNSLTVGPQVRYYFLLGSHWAIFPEASYSYGWLWDRTPYADFTTTPITVRYYNTTLTTSTLRGSVGAVYFLNKNIGIEGKVYYQHLKSSYDDNEQEVPLTVTSKSPAVGVSIGVQIYFSGKRE